MKYHIYFWSKVFSFLPYRFLMAVGSGIGCLLYWFSAGMRRITRINLELCFPELTKVERKKLLKQSFKSAGKAVLETMLAIGASNKRLQPLAYFEGLEYLEAAQKKGKGVIIMGGHFTCLQLAGRLFAADRKLFTVYRPHKKAWLEEFNHFILSKYYQPVPRQDLRGMLRLLKRNELLWYTPDVDAGRKHSEFVPFFGIATATVNASSKLPKVSGAAVVPVEFYRLEDGRGYKIIFHPALEEYPSDSLVDDLTRVNATLEAMVRRHPDQYLWQYRRFKTRPPGELRFYSKSVRK